MTAAPPTHLRLQAVDLGSDVHTHSTWTDGADGLDAMADAAVAAGLHTWGISDHVRADSTWLPEYVAQVRALRRDGLTVRCGVEVKMLDDRGRLDLPPDLPPLDLVLVADHQFPGVDGPVHPREVANAVTAGHTPAAAVVERVVLATAAAVRRSPAPTVIAHLFSVLPKCAVDERDLEPALLRHLLAELASACRAADAAVEANEKWGCPASGVLVTLADAGVRVVAGSDAHRASDVGRFDRVLDALGRPARTGARRSP